MNNPVQIPPYLGKIAEYALINLEKNGFSPENCRATSIRASIAERQVVFTQSVLAGNERHLLDCWGIFDLSRLLLEDPFRRFSKLKITVIFKGGKTKEINYRIYPEI